jgi:hypothetical protein
MRKTLLAALGLAAVLTLVPSVAFAWHPEIQGSQTCVLNEAGDGVNYVLFYTASAWQTDNPEHRVNHMISIRLTDAETQDIVYDKHNAGQFVPENGFQFSGAIDLGSQPRTVILRANAEMPWGPDPEDPESEGEGGSREVTVAPATDCPPPPTTTVAPTTTSAPATAVVRATASPSAQPGSTAGENQLPFTGTGAVPTTIAGAALLLVGYAALRISRHRATHLRRNG